MIDLEFRHAFPVRSGGFKMHVKLCSASRRLALFGASGSGKSLTMQALAGLFTPREGRITALGRTFFDSALRLNLPARERNLGYLFQDYALFPHLTVRQNIAFALNTSLKSRKNIQKKQKVAEMLETFEIAHLADLRPSGISGGQKQRVALARALAGQPDLLLLDEPFSALDPLLRQRVREQCLELLGRFDTPTVIISHDPADVRVFADAVSFYHSGENSACLSLADLRASAAGLDSPVRALAQAILQDA